MNALRTITPASIDFSERQAPVASATQIAELQMQLDRSVEGEVRFDEGSKAIYAVDSSNYRQVPIGVVIPKSIEDVVNTVSACRRFKVPLLSRGGGTSLAGQCCNTAIVMDWSKYLGQILNIDPLRKQAVVRPGCILDNLRNAAGQYGLTFGPDPATHNHCTLGGMLGNNSCGIHAQMAGSVASNTEALEVLLYDGRACTLAGQTKSRCRAKLQRAVAPEKFIDPSTNFATNMLRRYARAIPTFPGAFPATTSISCCPMKKGVSIWRVLSLGQKERW